jgi:hypothetical protein
MNIRINSSKIQLIIQLEAKIQTNKIKRVNSKMTGTKSRTSFKVNAKDSCSKQGIIYTGLIHSLMRTSLVCRIKSQH